MTDMQIVPAGNIPTSTRSVAGDDPVDVFRVCHQLEQVCRHYNGLGISAVQVGLDWKLFVANIDGVCHYYADCEYVPVTDKKTKQIEECLFLPGQFFYVERWERVKVEGYELLIAGRIPRFVPYSSEVDQLTAIVFQHEIDHHNAKLISD